MKLVYRFLFSVLLVLTTCKVSAQDKFDIFENLIDNPSITRDSLYRYLYEWGKEDSKDARYLSAMTIYHLMLTEDNLAVRSGGVMDYDFDKNPMLPDTVGGFGVDDVEPYRFYYQDKGGALDNFKKAISYTNKNIELHPKMLGLYLHRIEVYLAKCETKYAAASARNLIRMYKTTDWISTKGVPLSKTESDSMFVEEMDSMCHRFYDLGQVGLLNIFGDDLVKEFPEQPDFRYLKALGLLAKDEKDKALKFAIKAHKEFPKSDKIQCVLAMCYKNKGDNANCKKYATMLLDSSDPTFVADAKRMLDDIEPLNIDFEEIKQWVKNNRAEYDRLLERFKNADESLTNSEVAHVYFGFACTEMHTSEKLFVVDVDSLLAKKKYEDILAESEKCLEKNPVSLAALFFAHASRQVLEKPSQNYLVRLQMLARMIMKDAECNSSKDFTTYKILWRTDEDVFVRLFLERDKTHFFSNPPYFFKQK